MDSNNDAGRSPSLHLIHHYHHCSRRRHHHHHFFYVSPQCPLHRPILLPKNHSPSCYISASYPSQNPNPVASVSLDPQLIDLHTHPNQIFNDPQMVDDEMEKLEDEEEEEEDGDPVFVLTDEWRDFFAKSEAKRRLAKKQAKKGNK